MAHRCTVRAEFKPDRALFGKNVGPSHKLFHSNVQKFTMNSAILLYAVLLLPDLRVEIRLSEFGSLYKVKFNENRIANFRFRATAYRAPPKARQCRAAPSKLLSVATRYDKASVRRFSASGAPFCEGLCSAELA